MNKIVLVIPTQDNKLCSHFGHCETFSFVDVDLDKKEIIKIEQKAPIEGVSCQCASWVADQGANIVLAGGIGARPMQMLISSGLKIISGCPELPIKELVKEYLNSTLEFGENSCSSDGEHHHCHSNGHCHH